jgi:hypothetical protein
MELSKIGEALGSQKKGTYISLLMQTVVPTPKKAGHVVLKITRTLVRLGISYANIKEVKEAGVVPGELPGNDHWLEVKGVKAYPFIIEGDKGIKIRFTKVKRKDLHPHVTYIVDGTPTTKEGLEGIVAPSYLKPHVDDSPIFSVKAENILKLGKEVI